MREHHDSKSYGSRSVTDLIRALVDPLEKLKVLNEASPDAVLVLQDGRLLFANRQAKRLLGLPSVGFISTHRELSEMLPASGDARWAALVAVVREALSYAESFQRGLPAQGLEVRAQTTRFNEGSLMEIRICSLPERDPERGEEVTSNSLLAAGTAHTFNNLLTAVAGLTELLVREIPPQGAAAELVEQIQKAIGRGLSLTNRLASFEGESSSELVDVNPFELLRELVPLLRHTLPRTLEVRSEVVFQEASLRVDAERLRRLLMMMALDGADELSGRGVLTFRANLAGSNLLVEIVSHGETFTGLGFETEQSPRLMAIQKAARELGGRVALSSVGSDRARILSLPGRKGEVAAAAPAPRREGLAKPGRGETILLVDDEEAIRAVGRAALTKSGYNVLLASNGLEALEIYERESIDLVVLDLVMPEMGGAACFEKLRIINPQVKVVLMSGYTANVRVSEMLKNGCLSFLRKPFDLSELIKMIEEGLGRTRVGAECP
ncbi:MAG: response regulator [Candidatus Eremiobacteraeota bacterium]|nr:response regulator [Candidatus Eremiobacteraeota bacterium]